MMYNKSVKDKKSIFRKEGRKMNDINKTITFAKPSDQDIEIRRVLGVVYEALKEKGYQVVSVSAMAKAHDCPLKNGSEYIRARAKSPNRVRVE